MKITMKLLIPITLLIIGLLLVATAHAGDAGAGKAKSVTCAGCHGVNGTSSSPLYPNLAGQHEQYLVKAITAYRAGERTDPTMKAMATPLTDADISNLAAFFSSLSCK